MANYTAPTSKNQMITLNYTGTIDTITITKTGLYKFDIYGGSGGGSSSGSGPKGGRSTGYKYLKKGSVLYVCIGGMGITSSASPTVSGGFNGGGTGRRYPFNNGGGYSGNAYSGGGASHIATISGTLSSIGASRKSNILLVAGGGGAGYSAAATYGHGGGTSGGNGSGGWYISATGGSQSSGGLCDSHSEDVRAGFGQGGYYAGLGDNFYIFGGGGGLYGGGSAMISQGGGIEGRSAGGGSGYIGGVPTITYKGKSYSPSTVGGVRSGHGIGYITLIESGTPTLFYGDKEIDALYYGDREIDTLFYKDREIN